MRKRHSVELEPRWLFVMKIEERHVRVLLRENVDDRESDFASSENRRRELRLS